MNHRAKASAEVIFAIEEMFRERGLLPFINETEAMAGYQNVMIGIAPVSDWGDTITIVHDQEERRPDADVEPG